MLEARNLLFPIIVIQAVYCT